MKNLHVDLRDFIVRVHEVTHPSSPHRFYALEALIIADIELSQYKSSEALVLANESLATAINRAHDYVLMKLHEHRNRLDFLGVHHYLGMKDSCVSVEILLCGIRLSIWYEWLTSLRLMLMDWRCCNTFPNLSESVLAVSPTTCPEKMLPTVFITTAASLSP